MEIYGRVHRASKLMLNTTRILTVSHLLKVELDDKLKIALGVDLRIMDKYERNKQIIETLDANDETIVATLPKPNSTNFVQANAV
jgi:hypothetical protein